MKPPLDSEPLPEHLERWTRELFGATVPRERKATCETCAMCRPEGQAPQIDAEYFDPHARCCTFLPVLPNFLVGRILRDERPELARGRASVLERIAKAVAVTPLGLERPADAQALYDLSAASFGKALALRCPHYLEDSDQCGIWRHRESTCATWFCKHSRGAVGGRFWKQLRELMALVEQQLACWCVLELGVGNEALRALFAEPSGAGDRQTLDAATLDRVADRERARELWGSWLDREAEFYVRCASLIDDLSWARVLEICEPRVRALAALSLEAFGELQSEALPSALRAGPLEQIGVTEELVRIRTYSGFDPLDVPHEVMRALRHFDGRPTPEVLASIVCKDGLVLDEALLRTLVDFDVLVPASAPSGAGPASLA